MLEKFCVYNSKIISPFFDGENLFIEIYKFSFQGTVTEERSFKLVSRKKVSLQNSCVDHVWCDVLKNTHLGFQSLILVVESFPLPSIFTYTDGFEGNIFEELKYNSWPKNLKLIHNINYALTDGPTLLVIADELNIFSFTHNTGNNYDLKKVISNTNCSKILQFSSFKDLSHNSENIQFFVAFVFQNSTGNSLKLLSLEQDSENGTFSPNMISLQTRHFFPIQYNCHVLALEVFNFNIFEARKRTDFKNNISSSENSTILCTATQCLIFHNGQLKHYFNNPLSDVVLLKTVLSCSTAAEVNILLQSNSKGVCCVNVKKEKVKLWKKAETVLLGDILMNGSKQLVLLNNNDALLWQNECEISEFVTTTTTVPIGQSNIPAEYLFNTVVGLGKKIVNGKLAVAGKQEEISQKTAAMIDVLLRLDDHSSENSTPGSSHTSFQDSLVDIILSKDENKPTELEKKPSMAVKFCNQWESLYNEFWIVCWTFINESERCICHPSVSIVLEDEQVQCLHKVFCHSSPSFSVDIKNKKQIDSKEFFTVVASLKIPNFRTEKISTSTLLSWYIGSLDEFDNEFLLPENERTLIKQQLSLMLDLSTEEIFKRNESKDESLERKLLPLRVLQQSTVLHITSLNSDFSNLEDTLIENQNSSNKMQLFVIDHKRQCLMFETLGTPLYAVSIVLEHIDKRNIEAEVFTRNEQETLLLIHWLYQFLPDDVGIFPEEHSSKNFREMKKNMLSSMKEEVDLLSSSLIAHNLNLDLLKKQSDLSNMTQLIGVGNVCIPKRTFWRIRKALAKKECITDNIARNMIL